MYDVNLSVSWVQNSGDLNSDSDFEVPLYQDLPEELLQLQEKGQGYFVAYGFDGNTQGCGSEYFRVQDLSKVRDALKEAYTYLANDSDCLMSLGCEEERYAAIAGVLIWTVLINKHDALSSEISRLPSFDYEYEVHSSWDELDKEYDGDGFTNYVDNCYFEIAQEDPELVIVKTVDHW